MACHHGCIALVETPAGPTQIAIENVVMGLMQCVPTSVAGVQQLMHSPSIPTNPLFHPFMPPLSSMLFTHKPSLRSWLAIVIASLVSVSHTQTSILIACLA